MFAGTPYAYLHICGTPWDGKSTQLGMKHCGPCNMPSRGSSARMHAELLAGPVPDSIAFCDCVGSSGKVEAVNFRTRRNKLALENVGFTIRDLTNENLLTRAGLPRQAEAPGELAWNQTW